MDIFLLFIFNIFTGAVIFLILSLKIEKTSSTFQEKKLRREMGEIITEFNSTAERNITLLENRISVLRKLLNENGSFHGVDFTVLDDKMMNNTGKDIKSSIKANNEKEGKRNSVENKVPSSMDEHKITGTFIDKIQSFTKNDENSIIESRTPDKKITKTLNPEKKREILKADDFFPVEDTETSPKRSRIDFSADEEITLKYEEEKTVDIEELFNNTEDKYLLIARLFNDGHSIDEIAKHSGLPAGEIKLVISLNS
ncbi:MAG: hypothetical protein CVV49_00965 [Spirochaetae bacterium HGW-Spirochaetae-5]|nr:MAG: hypothetical protein CVV49_00965 [Spirochaetae bacterium HGW-Spirochaetae-5]